MSKSSAAIPDYLAIRTGSLVGDRPTTFDTYVKVGTRFVLYCRNGDVFDKQRLTRLKSKNIPNLYIVKTDQMPYHQYLQQNVEAAYGGKNRPLEMRTMVILGYNSELIDKIFQALDDLDTYAEAKSSSHRFEDFITSEEASLKTLIDIPNEDGSVAQHGVRVGALSVALAQHMNLIDNSRPISLMVLGAFLHDLEHSHSNFNIVRPIKELTPEELKAYKRHPLEGAARIQQIGHYDALVSQIILQHEEHADGTGFPKGLEQDDMDPLVSVVAVANAFDRQITFEKRAPKDALRALLIDKMGAYPLDTLKAMQDMLKKNGIVTG